MIEFIDDEWIKTMLCIKGIQSIFAVVVTGQSPQMVGWLEKKWSAANGNEYRTIILSEEIFSKKLEKALIAEHSEETSYCK